MKMISTRTARKRKFTTYVCANMVRTFVYVAGVSIVCFCRSGSLSECTYLLQRKKLFCQKLELCWNSQLH